MPTSSQAMIIRNRELDDSLWRRTSSRTTTPCAVKSVDLNMAFDAPCKDFGTQILERYLTQDKRPIKENFSKVMKIHGYRTILSYDAENGAFSWKFLPDELLIANSENNSKTRILKQERCSQPTLPKTKQHVSASGLSKETITKSDIPQDILSLGFRSPYTGNRRSLVVNKAATRGASAPIINKRDEISRESDHLGGWINIPSKVEEDRIPKRIHQGEHSENDEIRFTVTEDAILENTNEAYEDLCLPSTLLLKTLPAKRPLTVCFSLRDNENIFHLELKQLIKSETGLDITELQYEPLSIRTGDPSINGRWLATFESLKDIEKITRTGFFHGKYHIIVKRLDDVNERGYRHNIFLQGLTEERQKLRLTKSARTMSSKSSRIILPPKSARSCYRNSRVKISV